MVVQFSKPQVQIVYQEGLKQVGYDIHLITLFEFKQKQRLGMLLVPDGNRKRIRTAVGLLAAALHNQSFSTTKHAWGTTIYVKIPHIC